MRLCCSVEGVCVDKGTPSQGSIVGEPLDEKTDDKLETRVSRRTKVAV